jgi:DNA polymerase IV
VSALCRDCLWKGERAPEGRRCPACSSPRIAAHAELDRLTIAHLDCDAFYASVEKRDRPDVRDQPVIVGGGVRGVVTTCCYIARTFGVRSAMPMFKARALCPEAIIIKPDFSKYRAESRRVMAILGEMTPLVQPLSLDEAWLDLAG